MFVKNIVENRLYVAYNISAVFFRVALAKGRNYA